MKLAEFQKKFVFTTKIELDAQDYIVLREPNQKEITNLSDNAEKNMKVLESIMPDCIIESTFTNEDGTPSTGKEICDALKTSGSTFISVLTTWMNSIPFQRRLMNEVKSDN